MKGGNLVLTLIGLGAALVWISRRADGFQSLAQSHRNINALVPTPAEEAAHWAANATGNPSVAASSGEGTVQPGTLTQFLGRFWPGDGRAWAAPNAGTGTEPTKPSDPAGYQPIGPTTPSRVSAQSQVQPLSPLLSPEFRLVAPIAFSPWFQSLSDVDPFVAAANGAGGYVDVQEIAPGARYTSEHA